MRASSETLIARCLSQKLAVDEDVDQKEEEKEN